MEKIQVHSTYVYFSKTREVEVITGRGLVGARRRSP